VEPQIAVAEVALRLDRLYKRDAAAEDVEGGEVVRGRLLDPKVSVSLDA